MKILLLSSVEHQSGSALRFRGNAGALARRGHDVHLVEPAPMDSSPETPEGVTRHPCPRLPMPPERQALAWLHRGWTAVKRVRPDVVYALKALPNAWIPAKRAGRMGARVAVDFDDLDYAYYSPGFAHWIVRRSFRAAARKADDATYHSEPMRELLTEIRGESRGPVFVEQAVDVDRFAGAKASGALRRKLGLGKGPVLLYAGHLGPASDLGPLLPALASLAKAFPGARLLIVGDGKSRVSLELLADEVLPAGFAVFAGEVPHREVAGYYVLADVALNFLEDNDANRYRASIKVREALAAGLPVVSSRTPDAERFGEFVRLADGRDAAAFVATLQAELGAPDRGRAKAGAEWLRTHATFDDAVRELAELWEGGRA